MSYGLRNTRLYIPTPPAAEAGGGGGSPIINAKNYYTGGFANRARLTRGIGWLTGLGLIVWMGW